MSNNNIIELTESNFQTILESSPKLLVDFWASWCGPCKMIAPLLDQIASEMGDQVVIGKVNIDDNGQLAEKYSIASIPTFIFFKNGEIVNTVKGMISKTKLIEEINKL